MKTIRIKLPERLDAELQALANKKGVSKSRVVREALEDHVRRRRGKISRRAFDLVKDLSGSVKGPADLLSNPKYMKSFGT